MTGESIDLIISTISPTSGTIDGGTKLTITGSGFPKNLDRTFTISINN